MKAEKFLIWLGLLIMVVGVIINVYAVAHAAGQHVTGYDNSGLFIAVLGPIWQGGMVFGIGKILEKLRAE